MSFSSCRYSAPLIIIKIPLTDRKASNDMVTKIELCLDEASALKCEVLSYPPKAEMITLAIAPAVVAAAGSVLRYGGTSRMPGRGSYSKPYLTVVPG